MCVGMCTSWGVVRRPEESTEELVLFLPHVVPRDRTPAIGMEGWDFTCGVTSLSVTSYRLRDGPIPHAVNRLNSCA